MDKVVYDEAIQREAACHEALRNCEEEALQQREAAGDLRNRVGLLKDDNSSLLKEVVTLETRCEELQQSMVSCRKQTAEQQKALIRATETYADLKEQLSPEIDAGRIRVHEVDNRLNLNLEEKVLFPSGSAELTEEGKMVLNKVGHALRGTSNRRIMIEGHTDNLPLGPELRKRFRSNWDLSAQRATAVVFYLQENCRIDPRLLSATGYSMYRPVTANDSIAGRRQNRRIEIVLEPLAPDQLQTLNANEPAQSPPTAP